MAPIMPSSNDADRAVTNGVIEIVGITKNDVVKPANSNPAICTFDTINVSVYNVNRLTIHETVPSVKKCKGSSKNEIKGFTTICTRVNTSTTVKNSSNEPSIIKPGINRVVK